MTARFSRRNLIGMFGLGSLAGMGGAATAQDRSQTTARDLQEAAEGIPLADVHCHAFPPLAPVTEKIFMEEFALSAWMLDAYFPFVDGESGFDRWKQATGDERARLDREYGIEARLNEVVHHFSTTAFARYLIKEMAAFFECRPTVEDVVAARNEYTRRDYWQYVNDLFAAVKLNDMYVTSALGAWNMSSIRVADFATSVKSRVHPIYTINSIETSLINEDISFEELVRRFTEHIRHEITVNKHLGFKSHIASKAGLDVQPWPESQVREAWAEFKRLSPEDKRRERQGILIPYPDSAKKVRQYLIWLTCDVAYELDVPFHIHSGDGGEGQGNLSRQYPYNMENLARYPVEFPQKPVKIVMVHGGYPHVGQAAYMSHIFTNVWYDMSLMNPIANRGLHERMLTVLETAPMSKILFGSDAYHLPEFYYLAGKWGRRYISSALAVLVDDGILTTDEAVTALRGILFENAHELHKVTPA